MFSVVRRENRAPWGKVPREGREEPGGEREVFRRHDRRCREGSGKETGVEEFFSPLTNPFLPPLSWQRRGDSRHGPVVDITSVSESTLDKPETHEQSNEE
jgi:hypothetical protein